MFSELKILAIHEASHACVLMHHGYPPHEVMISSSGGGVSFPNRTDDRTRMLAAMAPSYAAFLILGVEDEPSPEDHAVALPYMRMMTGKHNGKLSQLMSWLETEVDRLVFSLEGEIVALSNVLLSEQQLDRRRLGEVCQREPALRRFAGLFPKPKPKTGARMRGGHAFSVRLIDK